MGTVWNELCVGTCLLNSIREYQNAIKIKNKTVVNYNVSDLSCNCSCRKFKSILFSFLILRWCCKWTYTHVCVTLNVVLFVFKQLIRQDSFFFKISYKMGIVMINNQIYKFISSY